jgi:hypothetical protein
MTQPKSAFDFSGPSIWTRDKELSYINIGKINGSKRRENIRRTETFGLHPLQSKSKKEKTPA